MLYSVAIMCTVWCRVELYHQIVIHARHTLFPLQVNLRGNFLYYFQLILLLQYLFNRNQVEIINKEPVDKFVIRHANSGKAINRWIGQMEEATFKTYKELKLIFPSVDYIGNNRYVFNIKGNDYRLVALILFTTGLITVCFIGTHAEYDKIDCLTVLE